MTAGGAGPPESRAGTPPSSRAPRSLRCPPASARGAPGRLVAGRYQLDRYLGRGAHGEVWEARDQLAGDVVAVKLLRPGRAAEPARVRREVAVLRLLRLPGVARLLDEGDEGGLPFLVMELVRGAPFPGPGAAPPCAFAALAGAAVAVLETLSRIHAAGVVHRDLKPDNVLLDEAGRPAVLDFGLSHGAALGDDLLEDGALVGTPAYLAPEQIRGDPVTPRTDLYALGVVLHEALAGRLPHPAGSFQELAAARLGEPPPPLAAVAPGVPAAVAAVVNRLLELDPEDRPRSAAEVLAVLRDAAAPAGAPLPGAPHAGDRAGRGAVDALPRLGPAGPGAPLERVIAAARAGRAVEISGPPGVGRSRCLRDAAEALAREGRPVVFLRPAALPFASLEPLLGLVDAPDAASLDEVLAAVEARLGAALAAGAVVVADDAQALDFWSAAALDLCMAEGAVLRAATRPAGAPSAPRAGAAEEVRLAPLGEADLRPLFAGPDRFFHLREDAARALFARTEGLPARVAEEVTAWTRAGLARWDGDALAVDRDALDRLDAGLRVVAAPLWDAARRGAGPRPPPHLEQALAWLALAWPHTQIARLAAVTGQAAWRVEAAIEELSRVGAVRRLPDGRAEPLAAVQAGWSPAAEREARRALAEALPPGAEGRLLHLLLGQEGTSIDETIAIAREAGALARSRAEEGRLGPAVAALREGLSALRQWPARERAGLADEELSLLARWLEIAMREATPHALDRVLYEISQRTGPARDARAAPAAERSAGSGPAPALAHLEQLARAALAFTAGSDRAPALVEAVPPFADPALERARLGLRVLAARRASSDRLEAVLDEVRLWAERTGGAGPPAALAGWMGRLRYQQGRFAESAALHAEAAEGEPWIIDRLGALLHCAGSWLDALRFDRAAEVAESARALAARCRSPHHEAFAELVLLGAAHGADTARADPSFVDAVAEVGVPDLEAMTAMTEAALLLRARRLPEAAALASRAHRIWIGMGKQWPALLMRCLALATGAPLARGEDPEALAAQAAACPVPGIGIQALALLAQAFPAARSRWVRDIGPLCASVPVEAWPLRMDVLSVAEARELLGAPLEAGAEEAAPDQRSSSTGSQPTQ